jgi:hypothetical protein
VTVCEEWTGPDGWAWQIVATDDGLKFRNHSPETSLRSSNACPRWPSWCRTYAALSGAPRGIWPSARERELHERLG